MRVIIAEDEKWVRAAIVKTIPFEKLGLTLVREASNGIEALELCKEYKPDILLTDIMMPGLSGLELIEKLHQCLPDIKIVIVSGHSDFEYAKAAMKYDVCEYVLKPIDEAEISRVLSKVKNSILESKKKIDEINFYKSTFKRALPLIHEKYLNSLIHPNQFTVEMIRNQLNQYDIRFDFPNFTIAVFTPEIPFMFNTEAEHNHYQTLLSKLMKRFGHGITFSVPGPENQMVCILNHPDSGLDARALQGLDLCGRCFQRKFKSKLWTGISGSGHLYGSLPKLYSQALEALVMRFWEPDKLFFSFTPQQSLANFPMKANEEALDAVSLEMKMSNILSAQQYVDSVLHHTEVYKAAKPDQVKEFLWGFLQSLIGKMQLQVSFIDHITSFTAQHPYDKVRNASTWEELSHAMKELIVQLSDYYASKNPVAQTNIMSTAKKLIDENYQKDISLEQIAKYVFLSPAYFSELFKKETGLSFIEYKTQLRIENAKKLILTAGINISEVCTQVGYTDPKYFSKLFKKVTGMSPYEFKEKGSIL